MEENEEEEKGNNKEQPDVIKPYQYTKGIPLFYCPSSCAPDEE